MMTEIMRSPMTRVPIGNKRTFRCSGQDDTRICSFYVPVFGVLSGSNSGAWPMPREADDVLAERADVQAPMDRRRGRGAVSNASGRFEPEERVAFDDGWELNEEVEPLKTTVREDTARTIITRNDSPDISFDRSINPYRGCEHGCIYCYARPSHCYLGHSAGLDFETQLYAKPNAAELLERELAAPAYKPATMALGTNTDPYQPIEREHRITRSVLEVLERTGHPVGIVTKSALVVRDIDILQRMAQRGLAKVALSVTTLDRRLARRMEPRASTPSRRLDAIRQLSDAGIPTAVMVAPVIPSLNDHEIEAILSAAKTAGAEQAGYVMLRLPLELKDLFREWLASEVPDRAKRVLHLLQSMHGGKDYVAEFGTRGRGRGAYADQVAQRFKLALKRLGLNERREPLRTDLFRPPMLPGAQLRLF
jgi:DNA repair photolyase